MDFLDPKKQKAHGTRLLLGYALIGLALVLATTILLYQAYGFGIDKEGRVIQNGLVFVSSMPAKATIYVNKAKYKDQTNTRLLLPAGGYTLEINRDGYRNWKRAITVDGGSVERFDYSFLFPISLQTTTVKSYTAAPSLATQSRDRRWLLINTAVPNQLDMYDLNQSKPTATQLALPADILAAGSTTDGWQAVSWAADNRHTLLKRLYQKNGQPGTEYILVDREDPAQSVNISILFGFTPTSLEFRGKAYDQFYAYDQSGGQVFTVSIKKPTPQPYLSAVLAFAADGDTVLYVTNQDAPIGKVLVRMRQNDDTPYAVRQLPSGSPYLVGLHSYSNDLYVAAGATVENHIYVYKDPLNVLKDDATAVPVPVQTLKVTAPMAVSFSLNNRFVMAQNVDRFAVYDAETDKGYAYQIPTLPDQATRPATWMDGYRLTTVSSGKVVVFDFDGTNLQKLSATTPAQLPFFSKDYKFLYSLTGQNVLTSTGLLAPKDL
jgi:hypothetical protein